MKFLELRLWNTAATSATLLPFYGTASISDVFCDAGYGSFSYPQEDFQLTPGGPTFPGAVSLGLDNGDEISASTDAGEVMRFLIETVSKVFVSDGKLMRTYEGRSVIAYLEDAAVYPSAWPTTIPAGHAFVDGTPGFILRTLIARAKARGALVKGATNFVDETSFTGTTTSGGAAWTKTLTINYSNGYSYLQALQDLVSVGLCEYKMVGRQLRVYNQGDLSGVHNTGVVVQRGRNIAEASSTADSKELGSAILIEGDENVTISIPDATAIANYRRRERYVQQGGITDGGTLTLIAQAELNTYKNVAEQITLGVTAHSATTIPPRPADPQPWVDYHPGEWVKIDRAGVIEDLQVQQIAVQVDQNRQFTVGLTVGTLLDDANMKLQRKINAIIGGNSGQYGPLPNPSPNDKMPPAAPASVTPTASGYVSLMGHPFVQVTVSWPAVLSNADGSACFDLDHYEVQQNINGNGWDPAGKIDAPTTVTYFSALPPQANYQIRVRAVDQAGNASVWAQNTITLPNVTVPPPTPSVPSLTNSVGSLYVAWDGKDNGNVIIPPSAMRYVEIHISTTNGFTPSSATLQGTFLGPNLARIQPIVYGTTYYCRLRTVDWTGNVSPATAQVSVTPAAILTGDIGNSAITAALLAAGAVTTTKIADGSISTPKIIAGAVTTVSILAGSITTLLLAAGSITTDKLAAGAITGQTITGGTISIGSGTFNVDASGNTTLNSAKITSGQLVAPDPGVNNANNLPGWFQLTQNDMAIMIDGTRNHIMDPSFEWRNPAAGVGEWSASDSSNVNTIWNAPATDATAVSGHSISSGPAFIDGVGGVDSRSKHGTHCLKTFNQVTGYNGQHVEVIMTGTTGTSAADPLQHILEGRTYTVSVYVAVGFKDTTTTYVLDSQTPIIDTTSFGVGGAISVRSTVPLLSYQWKMQEYLVRGIDGFDIVDTQATSSTTAAGFPTIRTGRHLPTDSDWNTWVFTAVSSNGTTDTFLRLPLGGWVVRLFKTFTVPIGYSTKYTGPVQDPGVRMGVALPTLDLRTSAGALQTTTGRSAFYDSLQIEEGSVALNTAPTAYCDGSLPGQSWRDPTVPHASISSRPTMAIADLNYVDDLSFYGVANFFAEQVSASGSFKLGSGNAHGTTYSVAADASAINTLANTGWFPLYFSNLLGRADDGSPAVPMQISSQTAVGFISNVQGVYVGTATICFGAGDNATGFRGVRWRSQLGTIIAQEFVPASSWGSPPNTALVPHVVSCSFTAQLPGGGYFIYVEAYQSSGASITLPNNSPTTPVAATFAMVA